MPEQDVTTIDLTAHEFDIPCDYAGDDPTLCLGDAARWVVQRVQCPGCGKRGAVLMCDLCKGWRLDGQLTAVNCRNPWCTHVFAPARHAYASCERLQRS